MADNDGWTLKNGSLTEGTAQKEYGISRDFIIQGIRAGKLEYREVSMYGNPCLKLLRRQLERYSHSLSREARGVFLRVLLRKGSRF